MKFYRLFLIIPLIGLLFAFIPPISAQTSANVQLILQPITGTLNIGDSRTFTISLRTSSGTARVSSVKAILQFNPNILEITNVMNSNLFCQYPTDSGSYASDNSQGILMITGFANGGSSCAFPQLSTTDATFGTVTFRAKASGNSDLDFIFTGQNEANVSIAVDTNSPPQMILQSAADGDLTVSGTTPPNTDIPDDLGITDTLFLAGAGGLIIGGLIILSRREKKGPERVRILE